MRTFLLPDYVLLPRIYTARKKNAEHEIVRFAAVGEKNKLLTIGISVKKIYREKNTNWAHMDIEQYVRPSPRAEASEA